MTAEMFVMGPCFVGGETFAFDPDTVPSILVDPQTGRPADVDAEGNQIELTEEVRARSVREPYCPACAKRLNADPRRRGMPKFDERDSMEALHG